MSTENNTERRKFTRIHFDADTLLIHQDNEYQVHLEDISFKGLLISSDEPLPLSSGEHALFKVQLGDLLLEIPAELTHSHEGSNRYGFKMENLELETMTHLRRLVELNLGDEALFERELDQLIPKD